MNASSVGPNAPAAHRPRCPCMELQENPEAGEVFRPRPSTTSPSPKPGKTPRSKSRQASCARWENDVGRFSRTIAEYHLRRELRRSLKATDVQPVGGVWRVQFPKKIAVYVSLSRIPHFVVAARWEPKPSSSSRYYAYSCTDRGALRFREISKAAALRKDAALRKAAATRQEIGEIRGQHTRPPHTGTGARPGARVVVGPANTVCEAGGRSIKAAFTLDGFASGSAALTQKHLFAINDIADLFVRGQGAAQPVTRVCIYGHTDRVGADALNRKLGLGRARAVESALRDTIRAHDPKLLQNVEFVTETSGYWYPVLSNATRAGRSRNRRVQVMLVAGP